MPLELDSSLRYDMPAAFGPSVARPQTSGYRLQTASVSFVTDPSAVGALLPRWFAPTERPVVSVNYQRCLGMDWMGGRDYSIVSVYVTATTTGTSEEVAAPYGLVIWESDCAPIIAGREFMGTPKLFATIPDVDVTQPEISFCCCEYGTPLLDASLHQMEAVTDQAELARLNEVGKNICRLHWKYIPGLRGMPDADYPVAMFTSARYTHVWRGLGDVRFHRPDDVAAPYSGRIAAALGQLPCVEMLPATAVMAVDVQLYRDRTLRLD